MTEMPRPEPADHHGHVEPAPPALPPATQPRAPVPPPVAAPYRLSDVERNEAISALSEAFTEGRLDSDEFHERMSAASEARLATDLAPLFTDLPTRTPGFLLEVLRPPAPWPPPSAASRGRRAPHARPQARPIPQRPGTRPPHPIVLMPLVLLIVASTHLWFLLPLFFVAMSIGAHRGPQAVWRATGGAGPRGPHVHPPRPDDPRR